MERELLLLGLLRQGDMHGYQLHEFINQNLSSCTDLKKSTAYFLLGKMAKLGWISETEVSEGNRPPRRAYHMTEAGEAVFQHEIRRQLASYHPPILVDDVGLAFVDRLRPDEATALLAERRQAMQLRLDALANVPPHPGAWQLLVEHQRRHLKAEINWLDEVISRLASPSPLETSPC